jgi:hypothetical protein
MEVKTLGDKVFMCETFYKQGTLVSEIKQFLHKTFGPQEATCILQAWKQYKYS